MLRYSAFFLFTSYRKRGCDIGISAIRSIKGNMTYPYKSKLWRKMGGETLVLKSHILLSLEAYLYISASVPI